MRESDILHEIGAYWVSRDRTGYAVNRQADNHTHAVEIARFARTDAGMSCAKAYANYKSGLRGKATLAGVV